MYVCMYIYTYIWMYVCAVCIRTSVCMSIGRYKTDEYIANKPDRRRLVVVAADGVGHSGGWAVPHADPQLLPQHRRRAAGVQRHRPRLALGPAHVAAWRQSLFPHRSADDGHDGDEKKNDDEDDDYDDGVDENDNNDDDEDDGTDNDDDDDGDGGDGSDDDDDDEDDGTDNDDDDDGDDGGGGSDDDDDDGDDDDNDDVDDNDVDDDVLYHNKSWYNISYRYPDGVLVGGDDNVDDNAKDVWGTDDSLADNEISDKDEDREVQQSQQQKGRAASKRSELQHDLLPLYH